MAQPQADGKRRARADAFAHGERVGFERIKGFAPCLAAMNVRAIGEVEAVIQSHKVAR